VGIGGSSRRKMMRAERKLQEAYSRKERAERLLSNLENLRREGSIDESQYESMKMEYMQMLNSATTEIEQLKSEIGREIESTQRNLEIYNQELNNLGVKFKVGELSADEYQRSEQRIRRRIEETQQKLSELKRLFESKTSADVGGYIEVKEVRSKKAKELTTGISFPTLNNIISSIRETSGSDFTEFVTTFEDVMTPRTKLIGLIGGILMIISLFLPWVSISVFGLLLSFSAFSLHGGLGGIGLIAGLFSVLAAFLERSNARGILHLGMGILAILALLIVWASAPGISGAEGLYGEITEKMMEELMKMITIREGFYLYIISFIIVIVGGLFELGEK